MGLILLEALLAGVLFCAIVWWTMFSGRNRGELKRPEEKPDGESVEKLDGAPSTAPSDGVVEKKPANTTD